DVAAPVDRARGAFPAWAALPFDDRARRLKGVRRRLLERVDEVAATIVGDTGKLTAEALTTEVLLTCELIEFYARRGGAALAPQRVSPGLLLHKRVEKRYEPLGGKDPMIVCADAALDRAAAAAVWGAFSNAGQTCMAVERVYVADEVYEPFVERVVKRTEAVRVGSDIGSMTHAPQVEIVERHL